MEERGEGEGKEGNGEGSGMEWGPPGRGRSLGGGCIMSSSYEVRQSRGMALIRLRLVSFQRGVVYIHVPVDELSVCHPLCPLGGGMR